MPDLADIASAVEPAGARPASEPVLDARHVSHRFGARPALSDVSLSIRRGEVHALLGPNGAGKTTLISTVCNLVRPSGGEARVFGHPHGAPEARRLIGLAEQDINLDRFLDVEETLLYHGGY